MDKEEKIVLVVTEAEVGPRDENFNDSSLHDTAYLEGTPILETVKSETHLQDTAAYDREYSIYNTRTADSSGTKVSTKQTPENASFKNENAQNEESANSFTLPSYQKISEADHRSSEEVRREADHSGKDYGPVTTEQHIDQLDTFHKVDKGQETVQELADIEYKAQESASQVFTEDHPELDVACELDVVHGIIVEKKVKVEEAESNGNLNLQPDEQNLETDATALQDEAEETHTVINNTVFSKTEIQADQKDGLTIDNHVDASSFYITRSGAEVDEGDNKTGKTGVETIEAMENIRGDTLKEEDAPPALLKAENIPFQEGEMQSEGARLTFKASSEEKIQAQCVANENRSDKIPLAQQKEEKNQKKESEAKINHEKTVIADVAPEDQDQGTRKEENSSVNSIGLKDDIQVDPRKVVADVDKELADTKDSSTKDASKATESHGDALSFQIPTGGAEVVKGENSTGRNDIEMVETMENIGGDNLTEEDASPTLLKAENRPFQEGEMQSEGAALTSEASSKEQIQAHCIANENKSDKIPLAQHKEEEGKNKESETKINNEKTIIGDVVPQDQDQETRNEENTILNNLVDHHPEEQINEDNTSLNTLVDHQSGGEIKDTTILASEARDLDKLLKDNSNLERGQESHYVSHTTEAPSSQKEVDGKIEVTEMGGVDDQANDFMGSLETATGKHQETSYIHQENVQHENKIDTLEDVQKVKQILPVPQTRCEQRLETQGSNGLINQEKFHPFSDFISDKSALTVVKAQQEESLTPKDECSYKQINALHSAEASAEENIQRAPPSVEEESATAEENQSIDEIAGFSVERCPEYASSGEEIAKAEEKESNTEGEMEGMTVERSSQLYPKGIDSEAPESSEFHNKEMDSDIKEKDLEPVQNSEDNSVKGDVRENLNETAHYLKPQKRQEETTADEKTNTTTSNEEEETKIDEKKEEVPQLEPENHDHRRNYADGNNEDSTSTTENPYPNKPTVEEDTDRKDVEKRDEMTENESLPPVSENLNETAQYLKPQDGQEGNTTSEMTNISVSNEEAKIDEEMEVVLQLEQKDHTHIRNNVHANDEDSQSIVENLNRDHPTEEKDTDRKDLEKRDEITENEPLPPVSENIKATAHQLKHREQIENTAGKMTNISMSNEEEEAKMDEKREEVVPQLEPEDHNHRTNYADGIDEDSTSTAENPNPDNPTLEEETDRKNVEERDEMTENEPLPSMSENLNETAQCLQPQKRQEGNTVGEITNISVANEENPNPDNPTLEEETDRKDVEERDEMTENEPLPSMSENLNETAQCLQPQKRQEGNTVGEITNISVANEEGRMDEETEEVVFLLQQEDHTHRRNDADGIDEDPISLVENLNGDNPTEEEDTDRKDEEKREEISENEPLAPVGENLNETAHQLEPQEQIENAADEMTNASMSNEEEDANMDEKREEIVPQLEPEDHKHRRNFVDGIDEDSTSKAENPYPDNPTLEENTDRKDVEKRDEMTENEPLSSVSENLNETAQCLQPQERQERNTVGEITNIGVSNEEAKINEETEEVVLQLEQEDHPHRRNDADGIDEDSISIVENLNGHNPTEEEDTDRKDEEKREEITENEPLSPVGENFNETAHWLKPQEQIKNAAGEMANASMPNEGEDAKMDEKREEVVRQLEPEGHKHRRNYADGIDEDSKSTVENPYPDNPIVEEDTDRKDVEKRDEMTENETLPPGKIDEEMEEVVLQLEQEDHTHRRNDFDGINEDPPSIVENLNGDNPTEVEDIDRKDEEKRDEITENEHSPSMSENLNETTYQLKSQEQVENPAGEMTNTSMSNEEEEAKMDERKMEVVPQLEPEDHNHRRYYADGIDEDSSSTAESPNPNKPTEEEDIDRKDVEKREITENEPLPPVSIEGTIQHIGMKHEEASNFVPTGQCQDTTYTRETTHSDILELGESEMVDETSKAILDERRNVEIDEAKESLKDISTEEMYQLEAVVAENQSNKHSPRDTMEKGDLNEKDQEPVFHQEEVTTPVTNEEKKYTALDTLEPSVESNFTKSEHQQDKSNPHKSHLESRDDREAESAVVESPRDRVKDKQPKDASNNQELELELDGTFKDILDRTVEEEVAVKTPCDTNERNETERVIMDKNEAIELEARIPELMAQNQTYKVKDITDSEVSNEVVRSEIEAIEPVNEACKTPCDLSKSVHTADFEDQKINIGDLHGILTSVEEAFQELAENNKDTLSFAEVHAHETIAADNETGKVPTEIWEEEEYLVKEVNLSSISVHRSIHKEDEEEEAHPQVKIFMHQTSEATEIRESVILDEDNSKASDIPEAKNKEAYGFAEYAHGTIVADKEMVAEPGISNIEGGVKEKSLEKTVDDLSPSNSACGHMDKEEDGHPQIKVLVPQNHEATDIKERVILNEEKSTTLGILEEKNEEASGVAEEHAYEVIHIDNETIPGTGNGRTELQEEDLNKMHDDMSTSDSVYESIQKEKAEAPLLEAEVLAQETSETMKIKENIILNEDKATAFNIPEGEYNEASASAEEHCHGDINKNKDKAPETGNDFTDVREEDMNLDNAIDDWAPSNSAHGHMQEEEDHPPEVEILKDKTGEGKEIEEGTILSEKQETAFNLPEVKNEVGFAEEHVQEADFTSNENIPETGNAKTGIKEEENLDKPINNFSTSDSYGSIHKEEGEAHAPEVEVPMHHTNEVKGNFSLNEELPSALDIPEEKNKEVPGLAKEYAQRIFSADKEMVAEIGNGQTKVREEEYKLNQKVGGSFNSYSAYGSMQNQEEEAHSPLAGETIPQLSQEKENKESVITTRKQSTALEIQEMKNAEVPGLLNERVHEAVHIDHGTKPDTGTGKTVLQVQENLDKTADNLSTSDSAYRNIVNGNEEAHPPEEEVIVNQSKEQKSIKESVNSTEENPKASDIPEEMNKLASCFEKEHALGTTNADKETVAEAGNGTIEDEEEDEESLDKTVDDICTSNSAYRSIQRGDEVAYPPEVELLEHQTTQATEIEESIILNEVKSAAIEMQEPNLHFNFRKDEQLAENPGPDMQDRSEDIKNKLELRYNKAEESSLMEAPQEAKSEYPKNPTSNEVMDLQIKSPFQDITEPNTEEDADKPPCNIGVGSETEQEIVDENEATELDNRTQEFIAQPQAYERENDRGCKVSNEEASSEHNAIGEIHEHLKLVDPVESEEQMIKDEESEELHGIPTLNEEIVKKLELKNKDGLGFEEGIQEGVHKDNEAITETENGKTEIQEEENSDRIHGESFTSTTANGSMPVKEAAHPPEVEVLHKTNEATENEENVILKEENVILKEEKPTAFSTLEPTLSLNIRMSECPAESQKLDKQANSEDKENQLEPRDNKQEESPCVNLIMEDENKQLIDPSSNKMMEQETDSPFEDILIPEREEMIAARYVGTENQREIVNKYDPVDAENETPDLTDQHQTQTAKDITECEVSNDTVSSEIKVTEAARKDLELVCLRKNVETVELEEPKIRDTSIESFEEVVQELEEKNKEASGSAEAHVHADNNTLSCAPIENADSMGLVRPSEPNPGNETRAKKEYSNTEIQLQNKQLSENIGYMSTSPTTDNENMQRREEANFIEAGDHLCETIEVTESPENMLLEELERTQELSETNLSISIPEYEEIAQTHSLVTRDLAEAEAKQHRLGHAINEVSKIVKSEAEVEINEAWKTEEHKQFKELDNKPIQTEPTEKSSHGKNKEENTDKGATQVNTEEQICKARNTTQETTSEGNEEVKPSNSNSGGQEFQQTSTDGADPHTIGDRSVVAGLPSIEREQEQEDEKQAIPNSVAAKPNQAAKKLGSQTEPQKIQRSERVPQQTSCEIAITEDNNRMNKMAGQSCNLNISLEEDFQKEAEKAGKGEEKEPESIDTVYRKEVNQDKGNADIEDDYRDRTKPGSSIVTNFFESEEHAKSFQCKFGNVPEKCRESHSPDEAMTTNSAQNTEDQIEEYQIEKKSEELHTTLGSEAVEEKLVLTMQPEQHSTACEMAKVCAQRDPGQKQKDIMLELNPESHSDGAKEELSEVLKEATTENLKEQERENNKMFDQSCQRINEEIKFEEAQPSDVPSNEPGIEAMASSTDKSETLTFRNEENQNKLEDASPHTTNSTEGGWKEEAAGKQGEPTDLEAKESMLEITCLAGESSWQKPEKEIEIIYKPEQSQDTENNLNELEAIKLEPEQQKHETNEVVNKQEVITEENFDISSTKDVEEEMKGNKKSENGPETPLGEKIEQPSMVKESEKLDEQAPKLNVEQQELEEVFNPHSLLSKQNNETLGCSMKEITHEEDEELPNKNNIPTIAYICAKESKEEVCGQVAQSPDLFNMTNMEKMIAKENNPQVATAETTAQGSPNEAKRLQSTPADSVFIHEGAISGIAEEIKIKENRANRKEISSTSGDMLHLVVEEQFAETITTSEKHPLHPMVKQGGNKQKLDEEEHKMRKVQSVEPKSKMEEAQDDPNKEHKAFEPNKVQLSDLLKVSVRDTIAEAQTLKEERNPELQHDELENIKAASGDDEEVKLDKEEEDEEDKVYKGSDVPVIVEGSRETGPKPSAKKSHNILSGVGSKVKHSIAKVKKVITGKSSATKTTSPK
ncbi:hypothetical protein H6P81_009737 [Aristolochia fimbriata]|uniref:Titin-like n=1 Tax=Aristolochia fimbriata TaxID=158543 RepID=A0AAV7EQ71_ARIFI|nr:hypothetical protein H6P81_009737 [Aristolochia fimbriata]